MAGAQLHQRVQQLCTALFCCTSGAHSCAATDQRCDIALPPCSTDALILLKVLVHHGVPLEQAAAKLPDMQAAMVAHFQANKQVCGVLLRNESKQACFTASLFP